MTELTQAQLDQLYTEWSALGAKRERERIIELLTDNCECMFEINEYYSGCHNHRLIALIKGEQK